MKHSFELISLDKNGESIFSQLIIVVHIIYNSLQHILLNKNIKFIFIFYHKVYHKVYHKIYFYFLS